MRIKKWSSDDKMRRAVVHNAYKNVVATTHTLNTSDKSEINSKINELLETTDGLFVCKACGKSSRDRGNIGRHVETHIEGLSFPCQRCDKIFRYDSYFIFFLISKHLKFQEWESFGGPQYQ